MNLHILSDLHLSTGELECPTTDADLIVLAGDLARPAEAMAWAKTLGRRALYVPGNHEFYGGSLDGTVAELKRLSAGSAVRVLDNEAVVIDGVRFLGSTLWTNFKLFDDNGQREASMAEGSRFMRDFSRIRVREGAETLFSPVRCAQEFARDSAWLAARLEESFDGPTVVITHHAPSPGSIHPRFEGSLLNACFVSNAEYLMDGSRVGLWVHGHVHDSFDYAVNGTRVVCNPRGYAKDGIAENAAFDPAFCVSVTDA